MGLKRSSHHFCMLQFGISGDLDHGKLSIIIFRHFSESQSVVDVTQLPRRIMKLPALEANERRGQIRLSNGFVAHGIPFNAF